MRRSAPKIELTEDELRNILDECYKDTKILKNEISTILETWKIKINEIGEIAVAGGHLIKLLDLRDKNIDKKLKIAQEIFKILEKNKTVVKSSENEDDEDRYSIPHDIKDQLNKIMSSKGKN